MRKTAKSPQAICRIMRTIIGFPFEILTKKVKKGRKKDNYIVFCIFVSYFCQL